ncbi:unnamed protein product [Thelazia callipaeda]|uniref:Ovule protein n=1 Tax=Thelazia callipaeda TaxID=103827 RepID=A0A0N5CTH3_THECL|nr:unnamed protein product [Thelazia callipaeda]
MVVLAQPTQCFECYKVYFGLSKIVPIKLEVQRKQSTQTVLQKRVNWKEVMSEVVDVRECGADEKQSDQWSHHCRVSLCNYMQRGANRIIGTFNQLCWRLVTQR